MEEVFVNILDRYIYLFWRGECRSIIGVMMRSSYVVVVFYPLLSVFLFPFLLLAM